MREDEHQSPGVDGISDVATGMAVQQLVQTLASPWEICTAMPLVGSVAREVHHSARW